MENVANNDILLRTMILYHGTSEDDIDLIFRDGIKPRGSGNANHDDLPSRNTCVYLATQTGIAPSYAFDRAKKTKSRAAVLELDCSMLDASYLLPDEDNIVDLVTDTRNLSGKDKQQQVLNVRDSLPDHRQHILRSMLRGSCAYENVVPSSTILRVVTFDVHEDGALACFWQGRSFQISECRQFGFDLLHYNRPHILECMLAGKVTALDILKGFKNQKMLQDMLPAIAASLSGEKFDVRFYGAQ